MPGERSIVDLAKNVVHGGRAQGPRAEEGLECSERGRVAAGDARAEFDTVQAQPVDSRHQLLEVLESTLLDKESLSGSLVSDPVELIVDENLQSAFFEFRRFYLQSDVAAPEQTD